MGLHWPVGIQTKQEKYRGKTMDILGHQPKMVLLTQLSAVSLGSAGDEGASESSASLPGGWCSSAWPPGGSGSTHTNAHTYVYMHMHIYTCLDGYGIDGGYGEFAVRMQEREDRLAFFFNITLFYLTGIYSFVKIKILTKWNGNYI